MKQEKIQDTFLAGVNLSTIPITYVAIFIPLYIIFKHHTNPINHEFFTLTYLPSCLRGNMRYC